MYLGKDIFINDKTNEKNIEYVTKQCYETYRFYSVKKPKHLFPFPRPL